MSFRSYDLLKLVEEHGETMTLRQKGYGTYDPQTSQTSVTDTDYSITAYFYNYNLGVIDPNNINRGTRKCLISALGLTANNVNVVPDTEDEIHPTTGNAVHIKNVTTLYSAGQALCYICDVAE